jgi:hypothetical protein
VLAQWIDALQSGGAVNSTFTDKSTSPSSRLMVEFPHLGKSSSKVLSLRWTPSSLLGMMTMGWLSAENSTQCLTRLMDCIPDLSRSVVGFMFERFVTLSVIDADRANAVTQHISDFSKQLSSSDREKFTKEVGSLKKITSWSFVSLDGKKQVYSITPTDLVVVEGTTTEESTWNAILQAVKAFNDCVGAGETKKCMYVAFAYDRTARVDGCIIFRPSTLSTYVIPMQLTIAMSKSLDGANDWVKGLSEVIKFDAKKLDTRVRTLKANSASKCTIDQAKVAGKLAAHVTVAAFCVVRPSIRDVGPFRTDVSTVISSSDPFNACPIVTYDFDSSYVATGLQSSLFALDSSFKLMTQKASKKTGNFLKLPNCYPNISDKNK